eukprot:tig00000605_g2495.t1
MSFLAGLPTRSTGAFLSVRSSPEPLQPRSGAKPVPLYVPCQQPGQPEPAVISSEKTNLLLRQFQKMAFDVNLERPRRPDEDMADADEGNPSKRSRLGQP